MIRRVLAGALAALALYGAASAQSITTPAAPSVATGTAGCLQYNNGGVPGCASGITTPDGSSLVANNLTIAAGQVLATTGRGNIKMSSDGRMTVANNGGTGNAALIATGILRLTPGTVANLATIDSSPLDGDRALVTDAVTCVLASAVTGSGSTRCPVYYDGGSSSWKAG